MNSKGQINDSSIAFSIIVFLTVVSVTFAYIGEDFGTPVDVNTVPTELSSVSQISAFTAIGSFFNYLFWGFGVIPFWINAFIMIPLKLILLFIITKNLVPFLGGG